jgi:hypothetical protein
MQLLPFWSPRRCVRVDSLYFLFLLFFLDFSAPLSLSLICFLCHCHLKALCLVGAGL